MFRFIFLVLLLFCWALPLYAQEITDVRFFGIRLGAGNEMAKCSKGDLKNGSVSLAAPCLKEDKFTRKMAKKVPDRLLLMRLLFPAGQEASFLYKDKDGKEQAIWKFSEVNAWVLRGSIEGISLSRSNSDGSNGSLGGYELVKALREKLGKETLAQEPNDFRNGDWVWDSPSFYVRFISWKENNIRNGKTYNLNGEELKIYTKKGWERLQAEPNEKLRIILGKPF